jgi:hypothetical protein
VSPKLGPTLQSHSCITFTTYGRFHIVENLHEPVHVTDVNSTIIQGRQLAAGQQVHI